MSENKWSVYLLSNGSRTYIGSTTDPDRRLRQHNGEIVGGARATSRTPGKWKLICWISGFENRSVACRWEKLLKMRARGLSPRKEAFLFVGIDSECPMPRKHNKHYPVPSGLSYRTKEI